jgi:hypothetical protein
LFVTAKGRSGIEHVVGIDPNDSGMDFFGKTMGPRDVARPDSSGKTVDGVIGLLNQIIFVLERDYGNDGEGVP